MKYMRGRIVWFAVLGIMWAANHAAFGKVVVTNIPPNSTTIRYPLVLVEGTHDGKRFIVETTPRELEVSSTTRGDRFRFLVDLKAGQNSVRITDGESTQELTLTYKPAASKDYRLKAWYVICKNENPMNGVFNVNLTPLYKEKISTQIKLMQTWSAEDMKRGGYGPMTFYPLYDENSYVDVGLITLSMTRDEILASKESIYGICYRHLPEEFRAPTFKNVAFITVKAAALGNSNFCVVGTKTLMKLGPVHVREIMDALASPVRVDYLTWARYTGVTLHETGHMMHKAWHPGGAHNIIQNGYDISRAFTLHAVENHKRLETWGDHQPLMSWNRFFMSPDPATYKAGEVKVEVKDGIITATSPYELAVVYYYIPNGWPTLSRTIASEHVKTYSMTVNEAWIELRKKKDWFNVMAVDVEGNMSYTRATL